MLSMRVDTKIWYIIDWACSHMARHKVTKAEFNPVYMPLAENLCEMTKGNSNK